MSGRRIRITAMCGTRRLVRAVVCACPVTGIVVVGSLGIRGIIVVGSLAVRGIIVIALVTAINSGLAESESGGRWASQYSFPSPYSLVWTGGSSECGHGDPRPPRRVEWVACALQVWPLVFRASNLERGRHWV